MVNYKRKIQKGRYSYITDLVDERFNTRQPDWAKNAAVLHKIVAEGVDYHKSGSQVPLASEMLDRLSGDCQDQTVLLSNLFVDAGLDVRVISVSKIGEKQGHVFPQVRIPAFDGSTACDYLRDTYEELFDTRPGKLAWSTVHGDYYFIADPGWSDYIGDRSSLTGSYIEEDGGSWEFHRIKRKWWIDAADQGTPSEPSADGPMSSRKKQRTKQRTGFFNQIDAAIETIAEDV